MPGKIPLKLKTTEKHINLPKCKENFKIENSFVKIIETFLFSIFFLYKKINILGRELWIQYQKISYTMSKRRRPRLLKQTWKHGFPLKYFDTWQNKMLTTRKRFVCGYAIDPLRIFGSWHFVGHAWKPFGLVKITIGGVFLCVCLLNTWEHFFFCCELPRGKKFNFRQ